MRYNDGTMSILTKCGRSAKTRSTSPTAKDEIVHCVLLPDASSAGGARACARYHRKIAFPDARSGTMSRGVVLSGVGPWTEQLQLP